MAITQTSINPVVRSYQLPQISPNKKAVAPRRPQKISPARTTTTKLVAAAESKQTSVPNPLAMIFGAQSGTSKVSRLLTQSVDDQQIRGRFLDVIA